MGKWEEFSGSIEMSRIYHERYHRAVANPVRKTILKMVPEGKSETEIANSLGLSDKELDYHLRMLEWGFCIEKTDKGWRITKEGEIIEHL